MKKSLFICTAAIMAMSFSGCSDGDPAVKHFASNFANK